MGMPFPWISLNYFLITESYHFLVWQAFLSSRALGSIREWEKLEFP